MNPFVESFYRGAREALQTAKDVRALKAVSSMAHTQLDHAFAEELSRSGSTIACCAGCFYCCHLKVDVQPRDAFRIVDFIRSHFSPEKQEEVLRKAQINWEKIQPMTYHQHAGANLACPLLQDGRCSVYPVRPSTCRIHHSRRVEPCKESFDNPESLELPDEPVPAVRIALASAHYGITKAYEACGYDSKAYDINAALIEAMTNPRSEKRWRDGKAAFPKTMLAKEPDAACQPNPQIAGDL